MTKNEGPSLAKTHANYSDQWWTSPEWLDWVMRTFGGPWFDPCPAGWQVGDPDGLNQEWSFPAYCNHPGSRGSTQLWWDKAVRELIRATTLGEAPKFIWCGFNIEQLRHVSFTHFYCDGWLVLPRKRVPYVWGGEDRGNRKHGELQKSVGNWSFFWSSVQPAPLPKGYENSLVLRTGFQHITAG